MDATPLLPPEDIAELAAKYDLKTQMGCSLLAEAIRLAIILDKKNADYSSNNISKFGMRGILVRLSDKLERLINLSMKEQEGNFESIEDTLLDIAGYSLIGILVKIGVWK